MNRKKDVISPETAVKHKKMAVVINRFTDLGSSEPRVLTPDRFCYLSEVGSETTCQEKGEG